MRTSSIDRTSSSWVGSIGRSMEEVRIGYHTAGRMRWITMEQADLLYRTPR
jgi:hypothetical protein